MAEALYRKYRPQVFEDVVGQEPIERTLKNAIAQDKVSHAYLFCGPRGTGKTTTARLLAKALLCQAGPTPDPDGTCEDCGLIAEGAHPDVYELDAASRTGVENVREEIISRVSFAPTRGRYKVYIIDEVHMLSTAAFNALLKTLEEPPSHVVFVLCTTDPQKVPETIHSRCQRFDFRRIAPEAMVSRLGAICIAENVEFEGEALDLIAHRAEGGLRNALTSLEQIIAFENGKVTLAGAERLLGSIDSNDMAEIIAYIGRRDIANCFKWTAAYVETGADLAQFVRDMAEHVRNLYVMALVGEDVELEVGETSRLELAGELQWFGPDRLARLLGVLGDLSAELKTSSNLRLAFEIALTRMVRPDSDLTLESLAERVEALESGYSSVAHVLPGAPLGASGAEGGARDAGLPVQESADSGAPFDGAQAAAGDRPAAGRAEVAPSQAGGAPFAGASADVGGFAEPRRDPATVSSAVVEAGAPAQANAGAAPAAAQAATDAPAVAENAFAQGAPLGAASASDRLSALANPAALARVWQAALSALKKQKQSYGVLFLNTKARFDADRGAIRVLFPEESTFVFNTVKKPDVQEALAAALEKAVGASVPFMYEQIGSASPAAPSGGQAGGQGLGTQVRLAQDNPASVAQAAEQGSAPKGSAPSPAASGAVSGQGMAGRPAEVRPLAAQQEASQPTPAAAAVQADDVVPYEEVPYDEMPYDQVPYEDFGAPMPQAAAVPALDQVADVATAASPGEPRLTPQGGIAEDPADVEALLQAGFGGNVVFSEVEDD